MFKKKRDIVVLIGLEKMLSFATPPPINIGFTREDIWLITLYSTTTSWLQTYYLDMFFYSMRSLWNNTCT